MNHDIDPALLALLVCPLCKSAVIYKSASQELICRAERLAFPVEDGIPMMLESRARRLSDEEKI